MVGVIDYGMGNLLSVKNALEYLGEETLSCSKPEDIDKVDRIILPGVGAFQSCIENLTETGFIRPLHDFALVKKKANHGDLSGNASHGQHWSGAWALEGFGVVQC